MESSSQTRTREAGLSADGARAGFQSIEYAAFLHSTGELKIYENGQLIGIYGTYQAGDVIRVERAGEKIYYKQNGTVFYVSTVNSTTALQVDVSIWNSGGVISGAVSSFGGVDQPTQPASDLAATNITTHGLDLNWNNGDGTNRLIVASLDVPVNKPLDGVVYEADPSFASGDTLGNFHYVVYNGTGASATISGLMPGTTYHFAIYEYNEEAGIPNYWMGGEVTVSATTASGIPARDIMWTNLVEMSVEDNTLTAVEPSGSWTTGATSLNLLPANQDGWAEMTVSQTDKHIMFGLSEDGASAGFQSIEYAAFIYSTGEVRVYENSQFMGSYGTYQIGDVIRVERAGEKIYYKQNGTVIYVSEVNSTTALQVDVSIWNNDGTISNAVSSFGAGAIVSNDLYAISSGNWADGSMWSLSIGGPSNEIPSSVDKVYVMGHEITIDKDATCGELILTNEHGDTIVEITDGTLKVFGQVKIEEKANPVNECTFKIYGNGSLKVVTAD